VILITKKKIIRRYKNPKIEEDISEESEELEAEEEQELIEENLEDEQELLETEASKAKTINDKPSTPIRYARY
jgi:hypothetical protein